MEAVEAAALRGGHRRRWAVWVAVAALVAAAVVVGLVVSRHQPAPPTPPATEAGGDEFLAGRLATLCGTRGPSPLREADRQLVAACLPQAVAVRTGNRPGDNVFLVSFREAAEVRLPWKGFVDWERRDGDGYVVVSLQKKRFPGDDFQEIRFFCRGWTPAEEVSRDAVLSADGTYCNDEIHPRGLVVGVMVPGDPFPGDDGGLYQAVVEVRPAP